MSDLSELNIQSRSLSDWLCYIEQLHPENIELGLERVGAVAKAIGLTEFTAKVITVAGTNGKGTTCAVIENILLKNSKTVGVYSSPHIHDYRERLRINGQLPNENAFCEAFIYIEQVRQRLNIDLTYFEFGTLAALFLLSKVDLDVILLEVGLGGRLDATNIVEPDISVVTTVDLDHCDWLGNTRELVGYEKAGIFRANKPAVCGDLNPPSSLMAHAQQLNCQIVYAEQDFKLDDTGWHWLADESQSISEIPNLGFVPMMNISTALAVIRLLPYRFSAKSICNGISETQLPGRMQRLQSKPLVITDVAHNAQATIYMAAQLKQLKKGQGFNKVIAVLGMLADKDSKASLQPLTAFIDDWYLCDLDCPRAASALQLKEVLSTQKPGLAVSEYASVDLGIKAALAKASSEDIIIIFGSFYTVSAVLTHYKYNN